MLRARIRLAAAPSKAVCKCGCVKARPHDTQANPLVRYRDFCDFRDGGGLHLGFSKIRNFNGLLTVGGQYAPPCQTSSKSIERLNRYGN